MITLYYVKPLSIIFYKYLIIIRPHQRQYRSYARICDGDIEQRQDDCQRDGPLGVFRFFAYTTLSTVVTDNYYYEELIIKYRDVANERVCYNNNGVKFQNDIKHNFLSQFLLVKNKKKNTNYSKLYQITGIV